MKANRLLGALLATGLGLAAITLPSPAEAQPKGKAKKEAPKAAVAADAPLTKNPIKVDFGALAWGMSPKQVGDIVDKLLDEAYRPLFQKVSPGVKMKALEAQLYEEKNAFRRSRLEFGKLPLGTDATPLRGEYTYLNKESMMTLSREGKTRAYFFIQDRLWKIVDEHKLSEKSPYGKDFAAVAGKLAEKLGVAGRALPADPAKGRYADEVDWRDSANHLRLVKRGDEALALIVEDNGTVANLASLRSNKPVDENAVDPGVSAAMRKPDEPPGPPGKAPPATKAPATTKAPKN
jgi:hypothetical protein